MANPFLIAVRQGLSFSDTCTVRTRSSLMAVQQERGSSPIELLAPLMIPLWCGRRIMPLPRADLSCTPIMGP